MSADDSSNPVSPDLLRPFLMGDWRVDPALDEISRDGQTVKLEPRKMQLLVALARRAGDVVTPDELLDAVWPGLVVTQSSIYQSVAQLRKTLGDNPSTPEYIATVPRKGYRLVAPLRAVEVQTVAAEPAAPPPSPAPVAETPTEPVPRPARRRWLVGAGIGLGVTALGGGAGLWWARRSGQAVDGIVRIAILPFTDRTEGAIEQATADGLANDVIRRFERLDNVLVLARNSSFTFRQFDDQRMSLRALKQQLNADFALVGELFRGSDRVRVAVRLLAVDGGKTLWQEVIQRPLERLGELPVQIAAGAMRALGLAEGPVADVNPLDAYELYLLGLNAFQTQRTLEGFKKARDYFQRAIDTNPGYARAYAGLALTWIAQSDYTVGIEFREASARAQPLVDKALTLDPTLLEGLIAQSHIYMKTSWTDGERARVLMQKAVDLYPGNAEARFALGLTYAYDEQPREAIRHYAAALEFDPLNYRIHFRWGQDATFLGDYESARVHFARAGGLMSKYPYRFLGPGQADYARGRLDDAVANYRLQFEQDPRRPDAWDELGWFYLDLGVPAEARRAFDREATHRGDPAIVVIEQAYVLLAEGRIAALPTFLQERRLDQPQRSPREVERLTIQSIAGRLPTVATVDALVTTMRSDSTPWVGSYYIFMGWFAWIDLAMLYRLAGAPQSAAPLLDEAQTMLTRLRARGNAFHTIPFLEARIAAMRGQRDVAITRLASAVDAGWRRAWMVPFDPALRDIRDDARVTALMSRVQKDMATQRTHLG